MQAERVKNNRKTSKKLFKQYKDKLKVAIVGPLPPPIGGTTVSFQYLVESLKKKPEIELWVLNTGGIRGTGPLGFLRFLQMVFRLIIISRKVDVITMHCSTSALHILGTFVFFISRIFRKPLIVRKFAGDDYRKTLGLYRGWVAEFIIRHADLYLAQTQHLVAQATERGLEKVHWFPTSRPIPVSDFERSFGQLPRVCRKFVYVGHVRVSKGLCVLAEAALRLPDGVTIDVYGSWFDDIDRRVFDNCPNVQYKGVLNPEDVVQTMRKYDAFVFPTHHSGEGYPGVIIEAYIAGLPVVTTQWMAIPEIVDDNVGILVKPKDVEDLSIAMMRLVEDSELFQRLCSNTNTKAQFYSSEHWAKEFVSLCREIV